MELNTVIISDIIGSRKLNDRERHEWQLFLKSSIIQINEKFSSYIEAPFMITKGDEFQGVLKKIGSVHSIVMEFERLIFPLTMRFGVGHGVIQKMGSKIPIEMDGPAFHRAQAALNVALIYAIKERWSDISYKRYWKYQECGTYERVAQEEGVSTQAVWDSLHNSHAMEVIQAEQAIRKILCEEAIQCQQPISIN
ncbi:MAG: SatD family protein [Calditrichaceae bacterium]